MSGNISDSSSSPVSLEKVRSDYLTARSKFLSMKLNSRTANFTLSEEAQASRQSAFSVLSASQFEINFNCKMDVLFPDRKAGNRGPGGSGGGPGGNAGGVPDGSWDNPQHNPLGGIFSNGDIRARRQGNSSTAECPVLVSELDRQSLAGIPYPSGPSPTYPSPNFNSKPRSSGGGIDIMNYLTGGAQTANPDSPKGKELDRLYNMRQTSLPSESMLQDKQLVLECASSIPELRGKTVPEIMRVIMESSELYEKLCGIINKRSEDIAVQDCRKMQRDQYNMTLSQLEQTVLQLDKQYQQQHGQLQQQFSQLVAGRTQEEMYQLSHHLQTLQYNMQHLQVAYHQNRQVCEYQVQVWRSLMEQEELLPYEQAQATVAQQVQQMHQHLLRQQYMQQQVAMQQAAASQQQYPPQMTQSPAQMGRPYDPKSMEQGGPMQPPHQHNSPSPAPQ